VDERGLRKKRDRELIELLNELRVALPGAQVLFAFFLVVRPPMPRQDGSACCLHLDNNRERWVGAESGAKALEALVRN
jgi:hypothetical protein